MTATPAIPHVVGVLGGGRMGAGIAHAFLIKGATVIVVERDHESAAGAQVDYGRVGGARHPVLNPHRGGVVRVVANE